MVWIDKNYPVLPAVLLKLIKMIRQRKCNTSITRPMGLISIGKQRLFMRESNSTHMSLHLFNYSQSHVFPIAVFRGAASMFIVLLLYII